MSKTKRYSKIAVFAAAVLLLLALSSRFDNKYTSFVPGKQGDAVQLGKELSLTPVFLVDHWQQADGVYAPGSDAAFEPTWIGEHANYRRGADRTQSPYGSRTYRYVFHYGGEEMMAALLLPDLADRYVLWIDDTLLAEGWARAQESFLLTTGEHTLTLVVVSESGYYSGMYFPGALGSAKGISRLAGIQSAVYGAAAVIPLTLALFCFSLWAKSGEKLRLYFALFCIAYAGTLVRYFGQFLNTPAAAYRFFVSDAFIYAMFYFALCLLGELCPDRYIRYAARSVVVVAVLELTLYLLFPVWPAGIALHGWVQDVFRLLLAGGLIFGAMRAVLSPTTFGGFIACSCGLLGLSLLINLLWSNRFEPACTLWQHEWCGLIQVLVFACLMEKHNRSILAENRAYQQKLEEMVEQRTAQLSAILEERRAFFSDMAHDLKAPVASLKAFIEMIRKNGVELDNELSYYLEQVERQQQEISRRVGSLNELNTLDRLTGLPGTLSVAELFAEFYAAYNPEAVVSGIHLVVLPPKEEQYLCGQRQKLLLVLENLFFNALRFTPEGGTIALQVKSGTEEICIALSDTGRGIPEQDLPHVFERFYVGENSGADGSGLGLYIVKSILAEHGGRVEVSSVEGEGSEFRLYFPLADTPKSQQE